MNLPNILTLSRIVLAVVLAYLLEQNTLSADIWTVVIFAAASLTDFYDGYLAKARGLVSNFGKIMDPVADKILLLTIFGVLAHIGMVVWWMFALVAIREVLVTAFRLWAVKQGRVEAAERAGKIKTVAQIIAVFAMLFYLVTLKSGCPWFDASQAAWFTFNYWLMFVVVFLTVYSGIEYFRHRNA